MAEPLMTAISGSVPHHGPITPDCPVECLQWVLSMRSFNPLARAYDSPFSPPRTVGDVMHLYSRRELGKIRGLGSRCISEIEAALVLAGLDLSAQSPRAADQERPAR